VRVGKGAPDETTSFDAILPWQANVHEHDIGTMLTGFFQGFFHGAGFIHHHKLRVAAEQGAQSQAHYFMVVYNQYA